MDPSRFALSRLVWLCRDDHLWVERHRLLAYGLGLLVRHGVTPCSGIPVFHHGRWVLLDDNGGVVLQDITDRVLFGQCRRAWIGGSVATETSCDGRPDQRGVQESVWRCHQVVDAAQGECRPFVAVH